MVGITDWETPCCTGRFGEVTGYHRVSRGAVEGLLLRMFHGIPATRAGTGEGLLGGRKSRLRTSRCFTWNIELPVEVHVSRGTPDAPIGDDVSRGTFGCDAGVQ